MWAAFQARQAFGLRRTPREEATVPDQGAPQRDRAICKAEVDRAEAVSALAEAEPPGRPDRTLTPSRVRTPSSEERAWTGRGALKLSPSSVDALVRVSDQRDFRWRQAPRDVAHAPIDVVAPVSRSERHQLALEVSAVLPEDFRRLGRAARVGFVTGFTRRDAPRRIPAVYQPHDVAVVVAQLRGPERRSAPDVAEIGGDLGQLLVGQCLGHGRHRSIEAGSGTEVGQLLVDSLRGLAGQSRILVAHRHALLSVAGRAQVLGQLLTGD